MKRVIISTVGTSSITNRIDNKKESEWRRILSQNANLKESEIEDKNVIQIIQTLKNRAIDNLNQSNIKSIRRASAELNGIYGIYEENLQAATEDIHYLIATDTYQGQVAVGIIESFLKSKNIHNVIPKTPQGLSTASTQDFSTGIDELIVWFSNDIDEHKREGCEIILNLVGSFKSLQGYLNTIGMFYADKIIYIFEGKGAELITIPRLPINIDKQKIAPYKLELALIENGEVNKNEIVNIPETLVDEMDGILILSDWGKLIWNKCKEDLLSQKLLSFDNLIYSDDFRGEYNNSKNDKEKAKLQLALAKVSDLLKRSNGDTSVLKNTMNYKSYTEPKEVGVDRLRLGNYRVSCKKDNSNLILRHYGKKLYVEKLECN